MNSSSQFRSNSIFGLAAESRPEGAKGNFREIIGHRETRLHCPTCPGIN
jgi:hypothetical protein